MSVHSPKPVLVQFGEFELDTAAGELRRGGSRVALPEQPFRLLEVLVEHAGQVVSRDQIRERLWTANTFVDFEHGLNAAVKRLRDGLGDAAEQPRFVETVPKRGYRFVAPVVRVEPVTPATSGRSFPNVVFPIATVLLAVAAAAAVWLAWRGATPPPASQSISVRRLTFDSGLQTDPVFSPDGRFIAYASNRSGNFDIWIQPTDGGSATQLTTDPFNDLQPTWAPDGATIFFRAEREGGGIFALSVADRHSRRVLRDGYSPQLSPDGQWLLYKPTRFATAYSIARADGSGSVAFAIPRRGWSADVERAAGWHPSGRAVFLYGFGVWFGAQIYTPLSPRPVDGEIASDVRERLVRLGLAVVDNQRIAWSADGRTLYFSGMDVTEDIWSFTVDPQSLRIVGGPARVTTGPELDRMPSVSRTTGALIFGHLSGLLRVTLFELDATGRRFTGRRDEVTPPDADTWLAALSADGEKLAIVVKNAGGNTTELQEITLGSMSRRTLRVADAQKGELIFGPRWSRDGRRIAYSFRTFMPPPFQSSIRLLDVGAGEESLLTTHAASASADNPWDWSRDGTAILASGPRYVGGKFALVRLPLAAAPAAERAPVVLAQSDTDTLWQAQESPDRRWVAYNAVSSNLEHSTLYVVAASGGLSPTALTPRTGWYDKPRWSADGRIVYFLAVIDGLVNAWGLPFDPAAGRAAGPPFQLTDYRGPGDRLAGIQEIGETEFSVSGRRVALSTKRVSGAIWSASPAPSR